jgi:hypothetical protein
VLRELTASAERLALVGLAKNTGKTEALAALLRELDAAGTRVGVTSVGRDGESHDVIDSRIDKPAVRLAAQSLLASTDSLLSSSGVPFEVLERTDIRTPLGRVLIVRLKGAGAVEVAGPSGAEQVREVSDAMLAHGAEQVLIDGAIDRRAASRPDVADGLLMSTGAVLSDQLEEIVSITRRAVELVRLPALDPGSPPARWLARELAPLGNDALLDDSLQAAELPPRFVLTAEAPAIRALLDANPSARWLIVAGALPEGFLVDLAGAAHSRGRSLTVVVGDPTKAFLATRDLSWYARQGIALEAIDPIALLALTVNPVAPQSHRLDSAELQRALAEALPGVAVLDVLEPVA